MPATATASRADSAAQARSAEIHHLHTAAGYEAGVRDPGCWDHIGRHMRADAEPVRRTPRRVTRPRPRPRPRRQALRDLTLAFVTVGLLAALIFGAF